MKYKCTRCPGEMETPHPPAPGYPCCYGTQGVTHPRSVMVEVKEPGMNYEPMWAVVDAHRRCADELERTLREITGDGPPVRETDRVSLFNQIMVTLREARDGFYDIADREGHTVRRKDEARCRVFAGRCDQALLALEQAGEL